MIHPKNKQIFAQESKNYDQNYIRPDELFTINKHFTGRKVLVLGCGGGRTLPFIYEKNYEVTAIDVVPEMVEVAKKHIGNLPIEIKVMDACRLDFPDKSFDTVFFPFHGIDYIYPDIYKCVSEARRVLKNNGVFIFNSHNRLYIRNLKNILKNRTLDPQGLITYRTSPLDVLKLKKYFNDVQTFGRASVRVPWDKGNWKDKFLKILPWFDKSTYFVAKDL